MSRYPRQLILRANEIWHDLEGSAYDDRHPEIFVGEQDRWGVIGQRWIAGDSRQLRILDVGCGTGFVARQIGKYLKEGDVFVCADLSSRMLEICKANLSDLGFLCQFQFLKLDGERIDLPESTFDYITMNSVLHHVPAYGAFLAELARLLRGEGRIVIGHEPNHAFFAHKVLWGAYIVAGLLSPGRVLRGAVRRLGLFDLVLRVRGREEWRWQTAMVSAANALLLEENLITTPLSAAQMSEVVDFHSPLAGEAPRRSAGIDVGQILHEHLPVFDLEYLESDAHLGDLSSSNRLTRWCSGILKSRYPENGSILAAILRKAPSEAA